MRNVFTYKQKQALQFAEFCWTKCQVDEMARRNGYWTKWSFEEVVMDKVAMDEIGSDEINKIKFYTFQTYYYKTITRYV